MKKKYKFNFIDLFAGIGGFHQAMNALGGTCVGFSEINQACIDTYKQNFKKTKFLGDIRDFASVKNSVEKFDVLCAGFPCQTFSKAGQRKGFEDNDRGQLFFQILKLIDNHKEIKFLLLENVRNLADNKDFWSVIKSELAKRNFFITEEPIILSPSNFGIPQIRERVYILGIRKDIRDKNILKKGYIHIDDMALGDFYKTNNCKIGDAWKILDSNVDKKYIVSKECETMIKAWNEFRKKTNLGLVGFPIWLEYFGLGVEDEDIFKCQKKYYSMPKWKQTYVDHNRKLYLDNKKFIDSWVKKYDMLNRIKLYQKFEWNCGTDCTDLKETIIQVRQSGLRVKRPNYFPSLVAMINTPIIWDSQLKHFRHITPREAANLQSFKKSYKFYGSDNIIYRQLGNSVNVDILKRLANKLFSFEKDVNNGII